MALDGLCARGGRLVLASTFLSNHFDLFGLRQVCRHAQGRAPSLDTPFVTRAFYRIVRHPLMLGFLIAFWAAPTMSLGHLLFALMTTGCILVAVKFLEERALFGHVGDAYRAHKPRVPLRPPYR